MDIFVQLWPYACLVLVGVASGLEYYRSETQRTKRVLRDAPILKIADAQEGAVAKFRGTVRYADCALIAPFSEQRCVYYQVVVDQEKNKGWKRIIEESDQCPEFVLEDGSGQARVQLERADVLVNLDTESRTHIFKATDPRAEALLQRHGRSSLGGRLWRALRLKEGVVQGEERVVVMGCCRFEPDPTPPSGQARGPREMPTRLRIVAPKGARLVVSEQRDDLAASGSR